MDALPRKKIIWAVYICLYLFVSSCFCLYHLHRYEQICTYTYLVHICSYCIRLNIHQYRQIWTCLRNMYHIRWKICTAMLAKWLGLLHGNGRSLNRFLVQTWEFSIFEERTGPPGPTWFENRFETKNVSSRKIWFYFSKWRFWL